MTPYFDVIQAAMVQIKAAGFKPEFALVGRSIIRFKKNRNFVKRLLR
jgi:hypothetical protein